DYLYLSTDNVLDGNDRFLNYYFHSGDLSNVAGSDSYTVTGSVFIPTNALVGSVYLLVATDRNNQVFESNEGNNVGSLAITVVPPDVALLVTAHNGVPGTVRAGDFLSNVSYTVANHGSTATTAGGWYDAVYLSTDTTFDANDQYLTDNFHSGNLGGRPSS